MIFYSEDTHYSFAKAVRVLDLPTFSEMGRAKYPDDCPLGGPWPDEVPSALPANGKPDEQYPSFGPGSIDVDKLEKLVGFFAAKGHPIIVSLNFGSTFKGAYDDVRGVCDRLLPVFAEHGLLERHVKYGEDDHDVRRGFWIHVDGALGAAFIPFLAKAAHDPRYEYEPDVPVPEFDFGLTSSLPGKKPVDMVSSLVFSGHKWMGTPWPCGAFMTKIKYQMQPPDNPEYIGSLDTTFASPATACPRSCCGTTSPSTPTTGRSRSAPTPSAWPTTWSRSSPGWSSGWSSAAAASGSPAPRSRSRSASAARTRASWPNGHCRRSP